METVEMLMATNSITFTGNIEKGDNDSGMVEVRELEFGECYIFSYILKENVTIVEKR